LYTYFKIKNISRKTQLIDEFGQLVNVPHRFKDARSDLYNNSELEGKHDKLTRDIRFKNLVERYTRKIIEGFYHEKGEKAGTPYYEPALVAEMERMYQAQEAALRREREIQSEQIETEEVESELDNNEETSVNSDHNNNETETEDGQESLSSSSEPDMEQNQQNQPAPESPATQQTENAIPGNSTFECDCNAQSTACSYHACSECLKQVERVIQLSQSQRSMPAEITIHIHFHETPAAASYTKYIVFWFIVIVFIVYGYNVLFGAYEATIHYMLLPSHSVDSMNTSASSSLQCSYANLIGM
jgi:hypothetical protein